MINSPYAAGKIPGGFLKREGKASEKAILCSRLFNGSDNLLDFLMAKHDGVQNGHFRHFFCTLQHLLEQFPEQEEDLRAALDSLMKYIVRRLITVDGLLLRCRAGNCSDEYSVCCFHCPNHLKSVLLWQHPR